MEDYRLYGIDLAKKIFHIAEIDETGKVVKTEKTPRDYFFSTKLAEYPKNSTFAFEACAGCHYLAQRLTALGHKVKVLRTKDVKAYAKTRQKNDTNDAIAICKAAKDPDIREVHPKTKEEQEVAYLHKSRQNVIRQRIQRSNSMMTTLLEFGYVVMVGKSRFAKDWARYLDIAFKGGYISQLVYEEMVLDGKEIDALLDREKSIDKKIISLNKQSYRAQMILKIPGIGDINASILSTKPTHLYDTAKDFSASLGLVPRQYTTGGRISLGGISKQGDRYARTMLVQAGRSILMRTYKEVVPDDEIYNFAERLKESGKHFNQIAVAIANKLARIAYACMSKDVEYSR